MAEASDILIAMADKTSNATYFNKAWVNLTGRPMEYLLNFGWVDLVHPDDREKYVNIYLEAFQKRVPFTGLFRVMNKNGEYRWLLAQGPPLFRPDGSFAGYISSCVDITEQVLARQKMQEAEQKARLALYSAELGLYEIIYDSDAMITDDRFKQIWGFDEDAPRNKYAAVLHPDDAGARAKAHELSLITGQLDYQARVIWKDQSVHWVRVTGTVIYDEHKKPFKLIGVVQDITDAVTARKKLEEREQRFSDLINSACRTCVMRGKILL